MYSPPHESDALILEAAEARRELSDADLRRILEHVAAAGFDPNALERVRGRVAGMTWRGHVLRGRDRLPPAEAKYVWHVLAGREWPDGTLLEEFVDSIRRVILDPTSGVFASRYLGVWQLGIVRRSGELRGPQGHPWILVDYRVDRRHWATAYQPNEGLAVLSSPRRSDVRWLRQPEPSSEP